MERKAYVTVIVCVLVLWGFTAALSAPGGVSVAQGKELTGNDGTVQPSDGDGLAGPIDLADANATIAGEQENETSGWSVATGDVTGDGQEDLLVGAPEHNQTGGAGAAYLFFGPVEDGQVNLTDANVTFTGVNESDKAGWSVAIGNATEDEGNEVIVGAPGSDESEENAGAVYVMEVDDEMEEETVPLDEADYTLTGESSEDEVGHAVAALDTNATVDAERVSNESGLLVGAPGYGNELGAAYLFQTVEDGTNITDAQANFTGEWVSDAVGFDVAFAGDFDDSGTHDALFGAPGYGLNESGAAYLVTDVFNESGTVELVGDADESDQVDVKFEGINAGDRTGHAVGHAGDFNNDSVDDVIVGAPYNNATGEDAGSAYVLFGSSDPSGIVPLAEANVTVTGEAPGDNAGFSVSNAGPGDVTCDVIDDVLVGAPGNDSAAEDAGVAYVVAGEERAEDDESLTYTLDEAHATLQGENAGDMAGFAVAGSHDLSGDDETDIVVTAPYQDHHDNAGTTYVDDGDCPADGEAAEEEDEEDEDEQLTPANFQFDQVIKDETLDTGEALDVQAVIENVGEAKNTQAVTLEIDGEPVDAADLRLKGGASGTANLLWYGTDEPGEYQVTIRTDNDVHQQTITVTEEEPEPADFQFDKVIKDEEINTSEALDVQAIIENVGESEGTQPVALEIDGDQVDAADLPLDAGASDTVDLQWPGSDEPGEYNVTVRTDNDSHEQTITVREPEPESIELAIEDTELEVNESTDYTVTAHYGDGTEEEVTDEAEVTSDNASNASVDQPSASVIGQGNGTATIDAAFEGLSDTVDVEVSESGSEPESIELTIEDTELEVNESTDYTVTAHYGDGTEEEVTDEAEVTSDDADITSVDQSSASVIGQGEGTARITAEYQDGEFTDSVDVTVVEPEPELESIELNVNDTDLEVDETTDYTVTAQYDDDSTEEITDEADVTSDDAGIASVDEGSASVIGQGEGSATITVEFEELADSVDVSITEPEPELESIELGLESTDLEVDETTDYTVTAQYDDGSTEDVTGEAGVTSDDARIASVDEGSASVIGQGDGSVLITAEYQDGEFTDSVEVTATEPELQSIEVDLDSTDLEVEDSTDYTVTAHYDDGTEEDITDQAEVTSDDADTASVDQPSTSIIGQGEGSVTITAEYDGLSDSIDVTVTEPEPELESVDLAIDDTNLEVDETTDYTVTAHYDDGTEEEVTADAEVTSDDASIASVDEGSASVIGQGDGTATITADYEGLSNTVDVNVVEPEPELESVVLSVDDTELDVDESTDYTVTAQYDDGSEEDVTDEADVASNDAGIASVDQPSTSVTGQGEGTATITAEHENFDDSIEVTVTEPEPELESIELAVDSTELDVDESTDYTVTAQYDDGSTENITDEADVTSDDAGIASVDQPSASVIAQGEGTATITAEHEEETDSVDVTVIEPDNPADQVSVSETGDVTNNNDYTVTVTLDWDHSSDNHDGTTEITVGPNDSEQAEPPSNPDANSYVVTIVSVERAD